MPCWRSSVFALLALGFCAHAIPRGDEGCEAVATRIVTSTVVQTVTVTARVPEGTARDSTAQRAINLVQRWSRDRRQVNPQHDLTLDPRVIATGFANDGQDVPTVGQTPSLTSTNNFINYCLTLPNLPITNGKQVTGGSCNPAPIGALPSVENMPSSKFIFPRNFATIRANQSFTVEVAIKNMQTGYFVNAHNNFFAAPQQLNEHGQIIGHSHIVIENLTSIDQTTPNDPTKFIFFKGLNTPDACGKMTTIVPDGLIAGFYKISSLSTASNHQPVNAPVAQHGTLDDTVYFTVTEDGQPLNPPPAPASSTSSAVCTATPSFPSTARLPSQSATGTSLASSAVRRASSASSASASFLLSFLVMAIVAGVSILRPSVDFTL